MKDYKNWECDKCKKKLDMHEYLKIRKMLDKPITSFTLCHDCYKDIIELLTIYIESGIEGVWHIDS